MQAPRQAKAEYCPGDVAPKSGIYSVVHGQNHRSPHTLTVVRDDVFPPCRSCGQDVRFEVAEESTYITDDWDFAGPPDLAGEKDRGGGTAA